jgi:hypothetical protein
MAGKRDSRARKQIEPEQERPQDSKSWFKSDLQLSRKVNTNAECKSRPISLILIPYMEYMNDDLHKRHGSNRETNRIRAW